MPYRVIPLSDGTNLRSNWAVTRDGRRVSAHVKKSAAKRRARREAPDGEPIIIHRTDGTVQTSITG